MREILSFIISLPSFLMDGGLISAGWSHQCRVFLWCAWWARPKLWLVSCCRASPLLQEGEREGKKHKGGGRREKEKSPRHHLSRPFKELSSGGLRALAHFPIRASQPCLLSPWEPEAQSDWADLKTQQETQYGSYTLQKHNENTETDGSKTQDGGVTWRSSVMREKHRREF